jgi:Tol biopolymer transport system component/DNA-binding SARP family transcriptional activator
MGPHEEGATLYASPLFAWPAWPGSLSLPTNPVRRIFKDPLLCRDAATFVIRLRVFGSLELCADDGKELQAVLGQPKRFALLAFLAAAAPSGFHRRDRLLALFWPEQDDAHARGALNSAVRFLRREMGRSAILSRGSDELAIGHESCWSDVAAYRAALAAGRYEDALSLYRGDLLDGFFIEGAAPFGEWLEQTRAQLRESAARAALALAEQREGEQNFTTAVSSARRAVELSDGNERVLRQLLEILERLGDRAGAVAAYETFEHRLAVEFETEPAPETRALIARIRGRSSTFETPPPRGTPSEKSSPTLGGWHIERELGRGGMATVYLARDVAHARSVALKVMRPELVLSVGVEQFLREIQITAQLAHPHILPLIDSGAREGVPYLVTPYVSGESLRARLARERRLSVDDALRITTEIAEAIEYAHRCGIVHRDVKPENVLLADGHAMVADFGVARALAASRPPPPASADDGLIVGSRAYMSPEQAAGTPDLDGKADVYSMGCVLFEMLVGEPPADRERDHAQWAGRPDVPVGVRRLVGDCIGREPDRRPSAAELLVRLDDARAAGSPTQRRPARRWTMRILTTGTAVLAIALLALSAAARRHRSWSSVTLGATTQLTNTPGVELDPAISPDGRLIAYSAGTPGHMRISVRPMSGGNAVEVSGESMQQHRWPSWSPDGSRLAFLAIDGDRGGDIGRLFVVPARGGARQLVAEGLSFFSTPAWSPDGRFIAYPLRDSIIIRDLQSGSSRNVWAGPRGRVNRALSSGSSMWAIHSLAWSPDGRRLSFVSGNAAFVFGSTAFGNLGPSSIWTIGFDGSAPIRVTAGFDLVASPVWTPDSRGILYVSSADGAWDVHHQALDGSGHPDGKARRLTTGLHAHGISLSRDGTRLAYSLMNYRSNIFSAPITSSGVTSSAALRAVTDENQTVETVDVTSDGSWLVFESNRGGRSHIYKLGVATGELVQLTNGPLDDFAPKWSPDGKWIAFHSREPSKDGLRDVYVMNVDGGQRTRISADSADDSYPRWNPDSRRVMFNQVPGHNMVSARGSDGHWSQAEVDSASGQWTSDGRFRVYLQRGVVMARPPGGPARPLASSRDFSGQVPSIGVGPDASVVYFRVIDTAGVHSFYSVPVTGGPPRLLVRLDAWARRPARVMFSTDGRHLYFTITQAESDVWVLALRR